MSQRFKVGQPVWKNIDEWHRGFVEGRLGVIVEADYPWFDVACDDGKLRRFHDGMLLTKTEQDEWEAKRLQRRHVTEGSGIPDPGALY